MSTPDPQGRYQPHNDPAANQPPAAPYGAVPGQTTPAAPTKKGGKGKFIALGCGILALLVILLFGGCAVLMASSGDDSDAEASAQSTTEEEAPTEEAPAEEAAADETVEEEEEAPAEEAEEEAPAENVPAEHTSALTSAETYSDLMNMSKQAIFDQLTS